MKGILKNWKTTLVGITAILVGVKTFITSGSIQDAYTSIIAGIGLIFAKDNDQTGVAQ